MLLTYFSCSGEQLLDAGFRARATQANVAEMVQGAADEIGVLKGIRIRGGAGLGITWNGGRLTELKLHAVHAVKYRMTHGDQSPRLRFNLGEPFVLDGALREIIQ